MLRGSKTSVVGLCVCLAVLMGCMAPVSESEDPGDVASAASGLQVSQPYTLLNLHAGLCLDVANGDAANGTNLQLWECNGSGAQQFVFEPASSGYYLVRNVLTGKCLDIWEFSTAAGANIAQYDCHGAENQQFAVEDVAGGGVVRISSRLSGMSLDAWLWGAANGTNVVQWPITGGDNQKFVAALAGSGGGSSTGCSTIPETVTVNSTIVVGAGERFDGGCRRYVAGPAVGDGSQSESQDPVFRLENGASLYNVVLGAPAADGIHTYGTVTLGNITWEDVGEDALTIKQSGTVTLDGGSARDAADKIFQINAASTFRVANFTAVNGGKFIRQNGGTTFQVNVVIDSCDISYMDEAIFRTDSSFSTVRMTNTRYSHIGD